MFYRQWQLNFRHYLRLIFPLGLFVSPLDAAVAAANAIQNIHDAEAMITFIFLRCHSGTNNSIFDLRSFHRRIRNTNKLNVPVLGQGYRYHTAFSATARCFKGIGNRVRQNDARSVSDTFRFLENWPISFTSIPSFSPSL